MGNIIDWRACLDIMEHMEYTMPPVVVLVGARAQFLAGNGQTRLRVLMEDNPNCVSREAFAKRFVIFLLYSSCDS